MSQSPYRINSENMAFLRRLSQLLTPLLVVQLARAGKSAQASGTTIEEWTQLLSLLRENPYALSVLYQLCLSQSKVFSSGITYTPPDLAYETAKAAAQYIIGDKLSVLDPACGGGILLRSLIDVLGSRVQRAAGIDLDQNAAPLTEFTCNGCGVAIETLTYDALLNPPPPKSYDAIIMNPPYGSSRDRPNLEINKYFLKNTFGRRAGGKINLYMAFVLSYLSVLKEYGVLTAIIPNSWLGINDGAAFRETLIKSRIIREIKFNSLDTFPDIGAETVVLTLQMSPADSFRVHFLDRTSKVINFSDLKDASKIPLLNSSPIFASSYREQTLSSWNELFEPKIALQAYRTGGGTPPQTIEVVKTHPFHSRISRGSSIKYLEGGDVRRYALNWSGSYLDYGPWLAEHPPRSRFSGPRIVVREILGAPPRIIQATILEEDAAYNRSILQIKLLVPHKYEELLTLLGYLNSSIASLHILQQGRKAQRALFPKLVIADLKDLPVPKELFSAKIQLAELVHMRLLCKDPVKAAELDNQIDLTIADALEIREPIFQVHREIETISRRLGLKISGPELNTASRGEFRA